MSSFVVLYPIFPHISQYFPTFPNVRSGHHLEKSRYTPDFWQLEIEKLIASLDREQSKSWWWWQNHKGV
ncbi:hypothetical protein [Argonema antarcticum]|uniref:hypothetical protein n=1 Tax=Argonema antarcticum TaxID=2942763 RepID=UPI00201296F2|nr:hypothetical protein [Argonema antarcticum]MCL1472209.1 hypothetical protein [Argonema antarcticum A004/B2]